MFGIGMPEMLLLLAIALIVIGPKKLPDLAKSLGRALGEFKKATSDLKQSLEIDSELKDVKNAFDDLNKDIKTSIDSYSPSADPTAEEQPPQDPQPPPEATNYAGYDEPQPQDGEDLPESEEATDTPEDTPTTASEAPREESSKK